MASERPQEGPDGGGGNGGLIPAVLYARVSTQRQAQQGTSLKTQIEVGARTASLHGAYVAHVSRDEGVSGALYLFRPGIQEALGYIERREAKMLIIYTVDRGGRDVEAVRDILRRVLRAGGRLVFTDQGEIDDSDVAEFSLTVQAAAAELVRKNIRSRTVTGRRKKAAEGMQPSRALAPYGYDIVSERDVLSGLHPPSLLGKYVTVAGEFERLADWCDQVLAGKSLRAIARTLNEAGVPTPGHRHPGGRGAMEWNNSILSRILHNPVLMGKAVYGRRRCWQDESRLAQGYRSARDYDYTDPSEWILIDAPAAVSAEVWQAVQSRLEANQKRLGGNPNRLYLLSGLVDCPDCGTNCTGLTIRGGHQRKAGTPGTPYYRCSIANTRKGQGNTLRCTGQRLNAQSLETLVIDALAWAATEPQAVAEAKESWEARWRPREGDPAAGEAQEVRDELAALDRKERAVAASQIAGVEAGADPNAYRPQFEAIRDRRAVLRDRLAVAEARASAVSKGERPHVPDVSEMLARLAPMIRTVLTAPVEKVTTARKREILTSVVEKIIPRRGEVGNAAATGAKVYLLSDAATASAVASLRRRVNGARRT